MNIIKFLDEFTSEALLEKTTSRRGLINSLSSFSKKAAMAAVPFGLAATSTKTYAQASSQDAIGALQLALILEYLEDEFYDMALESGVITDSDVQTTMQKISQHEQAHVDLLISVLESLDATVPEKPTFDFTAGGLFDPFNESNGDAATAYAQLLALSQAFEDTGVRAYKGQAGNLMSNDDLLTAGLQIHSVEARHASQVRRIRGLKGWITRDERGPNMPSQTQPVYDGEQNVTHLGVNVTTLGTGAPFSVDASTQAYDEILTGDEATAIASLFIEG